MEHVHNIRKYIIQFLNYSPNDDDDPFYDGFVQNQHKFFTMFSADDLVSLYRIATISVRNVCEH